MFGENNIGANFEQSMPYSAWRSSRTLVCHGSARAMVTMRPRSSPCAGALETNWMCQTATRIPRRLQVSQRPEQERNVALLAKRRVLPAGDSALACLPGTPYLPYCLAGGTLMAEPWPRTSCAGWGQQGLCGGMAAADPRYVRP